MVLRSSARPPSLLASRKRRAMISLTPLIDVVFILLIFFMLASSFLDWRSIELNAPAEVGGGSAVEGAVLVEVRKDGLRLSGETVSLDGLVRRIGELVAGDPEQRVLVRPAPEVALQDTVVVLDRLTAAGITQLSLIRDP